MKIGICITFDEEGNVIEEAKVIIEDGATTAVRKGNHFEFGWLERE